MSVEFHKRLVVGEGGSKGGILCKSLVGGGVRSGGGIMCL